MWDLEDRSCCPRVFSSHRFLILYSCFLFIFFIFCFLGTTAAMEAMIERTEPTTEYEEEEEWAMDSGGL